MNDLSTALADCIRMIDRGRVSTVVLRHARATLAAHEPGPWTVYAARSGGDVVLARLEFPTLRAARRHIANVLRAARHRNERPRVQRHYWTIRSTTYTIEHEPV